MNSTSLKPFAKQQYLNLETFRKNGLGVPTPVWFAEEAGVIYIRTLDGSGKVKRIRNNDRVRIAPCDARGRRKGEWVEGEARLVTDGASADKANRLLDRKYGLVKKMFELANRLQKASWITIIITLC